MKFGILSQWFEPEPVGGAVCGSLARELARRGHEVKVLTGFPNYPTGALYPNYALRSRQDTHDQGVSVRRVALYPSHDSSTSRRLLNYGTFSLSASTLGLSWLKGLDALWVYNSPASIALPMWAAKGLLGVPHVLHIMDLWPDSIFMTDFGNRQGFPKPVVRGLHAWCNRMYRTSSSIAYVAQGMGEELTRRGVDPAKLRYVPLWADEVVAAQAPPRTRAELGLHSEDFVVLYAGALGASQGLESLIEAVALVRGRFPVICLIAGVGTASEHLRTLARAQGLDNVRFLGQVPRAELAGLARAADLHVVTLRESATSQLTMPSKIQTTLAMGKPFIAAVAGSARTAAIQSGAAFLAEPGDPSSIAAALLQAQLVGPERLDAMGQIGLRHYEETYAVGLGVDSLEAMLMTAAAERSRP